MSQEDFAAHQKIHDQWRETPIPTGSTDKARDIQTQMQHYALRRDGHKCRRCMAKGNKGASRFWTTKSNLTVHHIIPQSKGGTDHLNNLITLCNRCHAQIKIKGRITITLEHGYASLVLRAEPEAIPC